MAVAVHADREQAVHVHDPAVLPNLHGQRVGLHELVRAGVQRPRPERLDLGVEVPGEFGHLRLGNVRHAELLDELAALSS